ncbi:MAG: hypothetical protein ACI8Y4_004888 [Candidatus Poriferisodalaceae bacterium]
MVTVGGDERGEAVGGVGAHVREYVLVGGHGEAGVGVAGAFGHDLDGDARGDEQGCVGVAEVVEPDAGHGESGEVAGEELADRFGVPRLAVVAAEDRLGERDRVPVADLSAAPVLESSFGVWVDASPGWSGS